MAHALVDWAVGDAAVVFPARSANILTNGDFTNPNLWASPINPASWNVGGNGTITGGQAAPAGGNTAAIFADDNSTGTGFPQVFMSATTIDASTDYCLWVFAKAKQLDRVILRDANFDGDTRTIFELTGGTVVSTGSGHTPGILAVGGGWYLCWIVFQTVTDTNGNPMIQMDQGGAAGQVDLDGTSDIYIWHPGFEKGSVPTWSINDDGMDPTGGNLTVDGTQTGPVFALNYANISDHATDQAATMKVTVSNYTAGSFTVVVGGFVGQLRSGNGTHYFTVYPGTAGGAYILYFDASFDGDIDDVEYLNWLGDYDYKAGSPAGLTFDRKAPMNNGQLFGSTNVHNINHPNDPFQFTPVLGWDRDTDVTGAVEPVAGSGTFVIADTQHQDYHFRLWVIPALLNLSNPQIGVNIAFRLWNTWSDPETIASVITTGSSVLTFDIAASDVLTDGEYRETFFQIGEGEPTIDAVTTFTTENLVGTLTINAVVSETFNIIPDVPVTEKWEFLTDILETIEGVEQRIALRRYPRLSQQFDVQILDLTQRRDQYNRLFKNIKVPSLVPMYQYGANATGFTEIGASEIFVDPVRTNMRVNGFLIAANPTTEDTVIGRVVSIGANSVTINSSAGFRVTPHWVVFPGVNSIVKDGSGLDMSNVSGKMSIDAESYNELALVRPGATRAPTTFDGITFLDRRPLIRAEEGFDYPREILDNETGARIVRSQVLHPRISGNRKFTIQRILDPEEMDYWRSFFDTIRGSQKSFLLSTYFPDLTLAPTHVSIQNTSTLIVDQSYYPEVYFPYETWKRVQLEYPNGDKTQHKVAAASVNLDGTATLTLATPTPDDPAYATISRISYLVRMRAEDTVVIRHYANYSELSFGTRSTDE